MFLSAYTDVSKIAPGPSRTRTEPIWRPFNLGANCEHLLFISGELKTGFSFHPNLAARTTPDLLWSLNDWCYPASQGYWTNFNKADGASHSCNRVTSAFTVGLYFGLPPPALTSFGRLGTSPVKLTSHFPWVNAPTTLTSDNRLTVLADRRRSF